MLAQFHSSSSADSWKGTQEKEEDPYASGGWGNNSWGRSSQASAAAPRQVSTPKPYIMLASLHVFDAASLLCRNMHAMCILLIGRCRVHASHIRLAGVYSWLSVTYPFQAVRTMQVCSSVTSMHTLGSLPQSLHKCGMQPLSCAGNVSNK